jgi:signal transduction histidine kinase
MRKNSLFNKTRFQIAAWYAAGTATILILVSFYLYSAVRDSYWTAINREISALGGTLHDALEPKLQEPGVISERIDREILPNLCVADKNCHAVNDPQRHALGITQQEVYYLRFYNLRGQIVAQSGNQPSGEIPPNFGESLYSIDDAAGQHYHRYSTELTTADGRPWGFLQVGRSMEEFDERLNNLLLRMLLIIPILMLFIILVSWWIAGRTIKPIYDSYAKMQQFTADAAHELRTPLTAIQTTVDLMKYYDSSEYLQQQQSLTALDRQTKRLIELAQDLLMISRLEVNSARVQPTSCYLDQAVPKIIQNFQALSHQAKVELKIDLKTAASLPVSIELVHLERLLSNLVANAIEHTPAGGNVTVVLNQQGKFALLEVIDTGIGMSQETQEKIFDRFYRANDDRGRQTGGAGLGLSIIESIVSNSGGTISVKSHLQKGSTFTVRLPLCK